MKLLLFADLHLDAPFTWAGVEGAARRRRDALRTVLTRIAELARTSAAEAVLCAGDLFEQERCTPDTVAFMAHTLESLHPIPVFLAPGNHDWFGPQSPYGRTRWSSNVHVFHEARLQPVELAPGLTLWGAAHIAPAGTANLLDGFSVDRGGVHLALFHGSERRAFTAEARGKSPHAPFDSADIPRAGLHHALVGHYHTPQDAPGFTYPGNPDPLSFGEAGPRGAVMVTVGADGSIQRQRFEVAVTRACDLVLDVTGCASRGEVRARLEAQADGLGGVARVTVTGEMAPEIDLSPADLRAAVPSLDSLMVRFTDLHPGYDFEAIGREPSVRGQFVRDVLEADLDAEERRRVLVTGLRALDGRDDLEVS